MVAPLNILMIEDRVDDADLILIALKSSEFEVRYKRVDTLDAFHTNLNADIDVILADYTLPDFNALDALSLLQMSGYDTPFIVVTGTVSEEIAVACIRKGATDYLLKDRLSRLGESIRHAIAERQLIRAKQRAEQELIILGRAIETSINAVIMTDLDGIITFINRAVLDMWHNESKSAVIGHELKRWLVPEDNFCELLENLNQNSSASGEIDTLLSDGQVLNLQYVANLVVNDSNEALGYIFIFINITERKRAEALKVALERERELREVRSRFIYMLVHEFRNPLMSVQVLLSLVDQHQQRLTKVQVRNNIKVAIEQTSQINQLIDDVLLASKVENASIAFSPQEIDIIEFSRSLCHEFSRSVDPSKHTVLFESSSQSLQQNVDSTLLKRAILNLLSNAVKYSPMGGRIYIRVLEQNEFIEVSIADQGIGIPEEDREHLFDGFQRGSNVGDIRGTGLGLMTVKQIVDIHQGTFFFESKLNIGTTFFIRLPRT